MAEPKTTRRGAGAEEFAEMGRYQEEMVKAGVLLAGEGLRRSRRARGWRSGRSSRTTTSP